MLDIPEEAAACETPSTRHTPVLPRLRLISAAANKRFMILPKQVLHERTREGMESPYRIGGGCGGGRCGRSGGVAWFSEENLKETGTVGVVAHNIFAGPK